MSIKKIDLLKQGTLLPPPADTCQQCAVKHAPEQAHNAQSLFYQYWFKKHYNRWPTWKDAIKHCPSDIKKFWVSQLKENGVEL